MSNRRFFLLPLAVAIAVSLFNVACSVTEESADGRQRNVGSEQDCDVDPPGGLATEQPNATLVSANSSTTEYVSPTTTEPEDPFAGLVLYITVQEDLGVQQVEARELGLSYHDFYQIDAMVEADPDLSLIHI